MTDIYLKTTENDTRIKLTRSINKGCCIYLLGYSFFDTSLNITNFSIEVAGNTLTLPDGNYNINSFAYALEQLGLTPTINEPQGSITIVEDITPLNTETAELFNSTDANVALGANYNTGILQLGHSRIFYINIEGIQSNLASNMNSSTFVIFNKSGGTPFDNIADMNYSNPPKAQSFDSLTNTKISVYDEKMRPLKISSNYPAYFHLLMGDGKSQYNTATVNSIIH